MNHASQMSVLIVMKDSSVIEIMSDYLRDTVEKFSNLRAFIKHIFPFTDGIRDFDAMYELDNKHLNLVRSKYPDAMTLYWGYL